MQRLRLAIALSTSCFLLNSCGPTREIVPLNVAAQHPERFVCDRLNPATRPALPAEFTIDWASIQTVEQARAAHNSYVASVRSREGIVAGYVVRIEQANFVCWNNMEWQRQFYRALPPE